MRVLAIAFTIFILSMAQQAMACDCNDMDDNMAQSAYNNADIVIEANIISTSQGWGGRGAIAHINVDHVHKGNAIQQSIAFEYNPSTAACGLYLTEGETIAVGLYDMRKDPSTESEYGYRALSSCDQGALQYYFEKKQQTDKKQTKDK